MLGLVSSVRPWIGGANTHVGPHELRFSFSTAGSEAERGLCLSPRRLGGRRHCSSCSHVRAGRPPVGFAQAAKSRACVGGGEGIGGRWRKRTPRPTNSHAPSPGCWMVTPRRRAAAGRAGVTVHAHATRHSMASVHCSITVQTASQRGLGMRVEFGRYRRASFSY